MDDEDVLQLYLLHPVPVAQGEIISMKYKDKTHQQNLQVVILEYNHNLVTNLQDFIYMKDYFSCRV